MHGLSLGIIIPYTAQISFASSIVSDKSVKIIEFIGIPEREIV
jgi:hypothetical protein